MDFSIRDEVPDDDRFDIYFDLQTETFLHARDASSAEHAIPLQSIFHPRAFLEQQKSLASLRGSDALLERAISLLSVFQEYMLPVVSISGNATEVVSIFERINSTGVRLGVVDFMRALTWSDDLILLRSSMICRLGWRRLASALKMKHYSRRWASSTG